MIQTKPARSYSDQFRLRGTSVVYSRKAYIICPLLWLILPFTFGIASPITLIGTAIMWWMIISPRAQSGIKGALTGCHYAYDSGGQPAGYPPDTKDCTIRAAAIATGRSYLQVRAEMNVPVGTSTPRETERTYLTWLGWTWRAATGPVPMTGRIIADVEGRTAKSGHTVAVIDGVVRDTWDSRCRAVIGYWTK